ncbi:MAG: hypothetical protein ACREKE_00745, partial [bacterium]
VLDALQAAEAALTGTSDPADPVRIKAQVEALARLEACLPEGLQGLDPARRAEVQERLRAALRANGLNLNWTRLRAGLARIGVGRRTPTAPSVPRLDILS